AQVRVIDVDVPAEHTPHLGERLRPVDEVDEGRIALNQPLEEELVVRAEGVAAPLLAVDTVHGPDECAQPILRQGILHDEVPLLLEVPPLLTGQAMLQTGCVHARLLSLPVSARWCAAQPAPARPAGPDYYVPSTLACRKEPERWREPKVGGSAAD